VTDEEFKVIRVELEKLGSAINQAVRQLVEQQAAINSLQRILEQKHLTSPEELERARSEAAKELMGRE